MTVAKLLGWKRIGFIAALSFDLLSGCSSRVHKPKQASDPVSIYLVSAAMHSGIVIPDKNGAWVEYGFGEYKWYAQKKDAWYRAFPCILWATGGTLGRRRFEAKTEAEIMYRTFAHKVDAIEVERAKATALGEKLRIAFESNGKSHWSSRYQMAFVPSRSYWFLNNCHDATAEWLQELGCQVGWVPLRIGLKLAKD